MVRLNRIYTRTGDDGTTALAAGGRRMKFDLRVDAYGTVDEANATLGLARLEVGDNEELKVIIERVQNDLFDLGADLATPDRGRVLEWTPLRIVESQVKRLEDDLRATNIDGAMVCHALA